MSQKYRTFNKSASYLVNYLYIYLYICLVIYLFQLCKALLHLDFLTIKILLQPVRLR